VSVVGAKRRILASSDARTAAFGALFPCAAATAAAPDGSKQTAASSAHAITIRYFIW